MRHSARGDFLAGLVATGASTVASPLLATAQTPATQPAMRRIDLHHHFLPQAWIAEARDHKPDNTWPTEIVNWRPQVSLETMDRYSVATAIVELGLPGVWW
ncbi:MAG TPA: hypothetical protein VN905_05920, partial [Candidatus Binatia bacterium]|nr:hypothetical protein [Candidatus Binatia bacterium]